MIRARPYFFCTFIATIWHIQVTRVFGVWGLPGGTPTQPLCICRPVAPGPLPGVPATSQTRKCPPSPCPAEPLARHASIVMGGVYPEPCRETVCPCDTLHRSYAPFSSGLTKGGFVCSYVPASVWIRPDARGVRPRAVRVSFMPGFRRLGRLPIPPALLSSTCR